MFACHYDSIIYLQKVEHHIIYMQEWWTWRSKCQQRFYIFFTSNSRKCIWLHCIPRFSFSILIILFAVNTKVDMRFNVNTIHWLSDRVREKILQMVAIKSSELW